MKNTDETKLTALALEELPPAEAAKFLLENPEAADEIAGLRALGGQLERAFGQETEERLSESQREEVLAGAVVARRGVSWSRPAVIAGLGLAAVLAVALLLPGSGVIGSKREKMVAETEKARIESELRIGHLRSKRQ